MSRLNESTYEAAVSLMQCRQSPPGLPLYPDKRTHAAMSHRKKRDYIAVLSAVMRRIEEQPSVHYVTMDFEFAMWRDVSTVMPTAEISGCGFHILSSAESKTVTLSILLRSRVFCVVST